MRTQGSDWYLIHPHLTCCGCTSSSLAPISGSKISVGGLCCAKRCVKQARRVSWFLSLRRDCHTNFDGSRRRYRILCSQFEDVLRKDCLPHDHLVETQDHACSRGQSRPDPEMDLFR
jgi:hypothetical protein